MLSSLDSGFKTPRYTAALAASPIQASSLLHLGPHAGPLSIQKPSSPVPTPTPGSDALNWISPTPGPPLHPTQAPVPHPRPPFPHLHPARSAWPLTSWARHPPLWVLFTLLSCCILPGTMSPWECSVFYTTYKVASCGCLLTPLECWQHPLACLPVWMLISPRSYCKI